jgi:hypothetical protein
MPRDAAGDLRQTSSHPNMRLVSPEWLRGPLYLPRLPCKPRLRYNHRQNIQALHAFTATNSLHRQLHPASNMNPVLFVETGFEHKRVHGRQEILQSFIIFHPQPRNAVFPHQPLSEALSQSCRHSVRTASYANSLQRLHPISTFFRDPFAVPFDSRSAPFVPRLFVTASNHVNFRPRLLRNTRLRSVRAITTSTHSMRRQQQRPNTNQSSSTKPAKPSVAPRPVSLAPSAPPCSTALPTSTPGPSAAPSVLLPPTSSTKSLSTPSNDAETSQPKSTEKIFAAIEKQRKSGAWSPTTSKRAAELSSLLTANANTKDDMAKLPASAWAVIDRLTQTRGRTEFLLNIGDWVARLASWNTDETTEEHQKKLEAHFRTHMDPAAAEDLAKHHSQYEDLKPRVTHALLERLAVEESHVQQWRGNGEQESNAPFTPWSDLTNTASDCKGFHTADYIRLLKLYDQRNTFAHRAPPQPAAYVLPRSQRRYFLDRIDWHAMRVRCQEMRDNIQARVKSGQLDKDDGISLDRMVE